MLFGNGLSNLPYWQYKKFLDKIGDRTKAADKYWKFLENKIRKPSLDIYNMPYPGYFYIATLTKEGLVNPLITTNWDSVFDRIASLPEFNIQYLQNPCCKREKIHSYDGYKCLCREDHGIESYDSSIRLWKIHGDINYVFLSCCRTLARLTPIAPIRRKVSHLDCGKEGKCSLQHHILEPRSEAVGFEGEIAGAVADLTREDSMVSVILLLGFSGWHYEEIVQSVVDISRKGAIKVFYVNPCNWKKGTEPTLYQQLKESDKQIVKEDANDVLREIVTHYQLFNKYSYIYDYYLS